MKRIIAILLIMLLPLSACAEDNLVYWIYPNGGRYYHLDQNCPSVNPKYLPLQVSITKEELEQPANSFYLPCNLCVDESHVASVPEEIKETGMPTEEPAWEMIIDPKYAEYTLKDRYVEERPVWIDEHNMLWKHYGTDNVWEIMTKQSLVLFIHVNDLHNGGVLLSEKERMISNALLQKLVEEH